MSLNEQQDDCGIFLGGCKPYLKFHQLILAAGEVWQSLRIGSMNVKKKGTGERPVPASDPKSQKVTSSV
jgi:hypothetical protein